MFLLGPSVQRWPVQQWLKSPRYTLLETRDRILTDQDLEEGTLSVLGFVAILILSRNPNAANRVLERLFRVSDCSTGHGYRDTHFPLELFWKTFGGRPSNTPWSKWSPDQFDEGRINCCADPDHATFFGEWTCTEHIERSENIRVQDDYDAHQWKNSQDMWTHATCARILCQPVGSPGKIPKMENIEETFEVVENLFSVVPLGDSARKHGDAFPVDVYFVLALYLGHEGRAREILKMVVEQKDRWWVDSLFTIPELYEVLAAEDDPPVKFDDEMEEAEKVICAALDSRAKDGRKSPMQDVPVAELLRRFSEGAFFVYNEAYLENGVNEPGEVLHLPLTEEEVTEVEEELGQPLPPDLRELILIADGFKGAWHFAGGGWGGIKNSSTSPAAAHEIQLGFEPEPEIKTVMREDGSTYEVHSVTFGGSDNDFGDIWWSSGPVECDEFEHIICPPSTWKNLQEAMGKSIQEGEYAYVLYSNSMGVGDVYSSIRAFIAEQTIELERQVAVGWREPKGE